MPILTLSIGSNIDAATNIRHAVRELRLKFGVIRCSTVFESEAVGFDGDNFLNLAVALETELSLADIVVFLKALEDKFGRDRSLPKFSGRSLDIDILVFGNDSGVELGIVLPRPEITENAFVLQPLAELQPEVEHSVSGESYAALWAAYDKSRQKLWPLKFDWDS